MTEDRLLTFLIGLAAGEENSAEVIQLDKWAARGPAYATVVGLARNLEALQEEMELYKRFDPAAGFDRWKRTQSSVVQQRSTHIGRRWLIAACVLLFIAGAVFIAVRVKQSTETAAPIPTRIIAQETIQPGRTTATLSLSDGRTIMLDSVSPGELAMQGNTRVVKTENSTLVYQRNKHILEPENPALPGQYNILTTPRSGQYQLTLPDGSRVWLNNVSQLRYPTDFPDETRMVELDGEAYFEIAKNAGKPFLVKLKHETVEVLGTDFNVMAYPEEPGAITTLLTGSVRVKAAKGTVELQPHEQVRVDSAGELTVIRNVAGENVSSWKDGYFYFNQLSLGEVMSQIARWYDVEVVYKGKQQEMDFEGKIDRNMPLNELLKFFDKNKIHCRLEGRRLIVLP